MTPEARQYLAAARQHLSDACTIAAASIPHVAGREAYLAGYHAAEAFIHERTGKGAKTHAGLRSEFARLAKDDPRIDREFVAFLAKAYELKSIADYGVGPTTSITAVDAAAAIETADRFISCIAELIERAPG
jgi:uncharacterized protein (UPF0332 family)